MSKSRVNARIVRQEQLATDVFSMEIKAPEIASEAVSGQFLDIYMDSKANMLPRPISICDIDPVAGTLRMVYRVVGEGTKEFSTLTSDHSVTVIGPLGNGFPIEEAKSLGKAMVIGGGIGIPPMYNTAKRLAEAGVDVIAVLGYRDEEFLLNEFNSIPNCKVVIASDTGFMGTKGTVIDAIKAEGVSAPILFSCGPKPMLRALKAYGEETNTKTYVSMEERMACGVGACLGCVCQSTDIDDHSKVKNKRVCKDGPVFDAKEVEL